MITITSSVTGGVDANRLRGGLKLRPLEPDPVHAGVGKLIHLIAKYPSYYPAFRFDLNPGFFQILTVCNA